jgi:PKD repeat protein
MKPLPKVGLLLVVFALLCPALSVRADTNQIGVITVTFTISSSGSGSMSWNDGCDWEATSDHAQFALSGEAQFNLFQSNTSLIIGPLANATASQPVSGVYDQSGFECGIPDGSWSDSYTFVPNPSFSATNQFISIQWISNTPAGGGVFKGSGANPDYGFMSVGNYYAMPDVFPPDPITDPIGTFCAVQAWMDAEGFPFTLANLGAPSSQTLVTNVTVPFSITTGGTATGTGTANCTVTVAYAPSHLTFDYTAVPTNGTAPLTVTFTAPSTDDSGNRFLAAAWNFGDGGIDTRHYVATHCYTNAGDYAVSVVFTNELGQSATGIGPNLIHVTQPTFTASPSNGPVPLTVQFSCPTTANGSSPITEWQWDFGDGTTSTLQNPTHTYTEAAEYEVGLTVVNGDDVSTEAKGPPVAAQTPTVPFTATPAIGAEPLSVSYTCQAADNTGNAIISWNWSFDDGGSSTAQNPSHLYTSPGKYCATLNAVDAIGEEVEGVGPCITVASRSGLVTNGDFETGDFYAWSNNSYSLYYSMISGGSSYAHGGDYGAELSASYGNIGQLSQPLATTPGGVYLLSFWLYNASDPSSAFTVSWGGTNVWTNKPSSGWTNVQLVLSATTTNTPLQFGFSGFSQFGLDDVDVENVFVQFTASPVSGTAPLAVQFNSPAIDNNGRTINAWHWYFGDGSTSAAQNPSHTYRAGGKFAVGLIATNSLGLTVAGFGPGITVAVPTLSFTANPTSGGAPLTVQFSSPSQDSGSNSISSRLWQFGDGTTSTAQNPSHIFSTVGSFAPSLVATNNQGVQITATGPQITVAGYLGLVVNGGFETGDFTGWSTGGNFESCFVVSSPTFAHSGAWGAFLEPTGSLGYIYQTLATTPGTAYALSLWLDNPVSSTGAAFAVSWNGTALLNWTNPPAFAWTNIQFNVTAPGSNTVLQFGFVNNNAFGLDDVRVLPAVVPRPNIGNVSRSGSNFVFTGLNGLAGTTYSLLTSTNLALPFSQWTLAASNTPPTSGIFTITATNAINVTTPSRFYLLRARY